jgi:hypothetical protein
MALPYPFTLSLSKGCPACFDEMDNDAQDADKNRQHRHRPGSLQLSARWTFLMARLREGERLIEVQ